MGGKKHAALVALFGISGALSAATSRLRRDEQPTFPYDPDTTSYCTWWWDNDGSISCSDMPAVWGISMADFLRWNPSVTSACGNFLTEHSYCVEAFGEPPPSSTTTTATTSAGAPGPTQPGQIATCNRWDLVQSGDSCDTYTKKYPGVTLQNLIDWNSEIGDRCQYLWVDYYICTGVTGFEPTGTTTGATPTSTNGVATPTPIQPGMVDNCDAFHLVQSGDDCAAIAAKYQITKAEFIEWNSGVGAGCSSLWLDYYVCVSIVGQDPSTTPTSTTPTPTNGIVTPTPIRPGMVANCDAFYKPVDGDGCSAIAAQHGITLTQFVLWNPEVKSDCSGLWLDYYVCVSIVGVDPTPITTTTSTPTNGIATPTPTRPGMVTNCDAFHKVKSGDECSALASTYGITLTQLYAWNTQLGSSCSGLWLDYYICVSIIGVDPSKTTTTTTKPTNGIATPTPTRPGMVTNCDAFYKVKSGDECGAIATAHGISLTQLYTWNTQLGSTCSGLWVDYYICVSIVGVQPTTTTTAPGNGVATPTPTQAGMTANCKTFHKVVSGDQCATIASKAGISLSNFYKWNSGIGTDCKNLWLSYYVCIGVL